MTVDTKKEISAQEEVNDLVIKAQKALDGMFSRWS